MSKIALEGNASGTGTFTLASPNSSTDRTLTLPDETGTVLTSASAVAASQITSALNATGSAPIYACRAWVNFDGTGTVAIRASGNVSSITDNGTGNYNVNFSTAMPDGNYAISGWCSVNAGITNIPAASCTHAYTVAPSTTGYNMYTGDSRNGNYNDMPYVYSSVFR